MDHELRVERRMVRLFFAGLLVVSAVLDIVGALLVQHQIARDALGALDRFQRSQTLRQFKEKFGPCWEDRYLVVPSTSTLPEVTVALIRAHLPPLSAMAAWVRSLLAMERAAGDRRALA